MLLPRVGQRTLGLIVVVEVIDLRVEDDATILIVRKEQVAPSTYRQIRLRDKVLITCKRLKILSTAVVDPPVSGGLSGKCVVLAKRLMLYDLHSL